MIDLSPGALEGHICPYCGAKTTHCADSVIYGKTYGSMLYVCLKCDAYVGCHKQNPTQALGRLADAELRAAKIEAHRYFDELWRRKIKAKGISKSQARKMAYNWLSEQVGIPFKYCHIGMMDVKDCIKVANVCKIYCK